VFSNIEGLCRFTTTNIMADSFYRAIHTVMDCLPQFMYSILKSATVIYMQFISTTCILRTQFSRYLFPNYVSCYSL